LLFIVALKPKKSPLKRELRNEPIKAANMDKRATILIDTEAATTNAITIINRAMAKNAIKLGTRRMNY